MKIFHINASRKNKKLLDIDLFARIESLILKFEVKPFLYKIYDYEYSIKKEGEFYKLYIIVSFLENGENPTILKGLKKVKKDMRMKKLNTKLSKGLIIDKKIRNKIKQD